jgi:hypothetical protein
LSLGAEHALVERASQRHRAEQLAERIGVEARVPRADCLALVIEHTHEAIDHVAHRARVRRTVGTRGDARREDLDIREIGGVAGPVLRFGDMERQRRQVAADRRIKGHGLSCNDHAPVVILFQTWTFVVRHVRNW